MRSTVDIIDSLDRELRRRAKALNLSFKEMLNRTVAAGLPALDRERRERKRYKVVAKACGIHPGIDWNHLNRAVDEIDDEERFRG